MLDAIHNEQIREHGGAYGTRDERLIDAALHRPQNRFMYEAQADLADLAASYAFGLAKNHGFVDGNKRVAFMACYVFLGLNGKRLVAHETDAFDVMTSVAAGEMDEPTVARWIRNHLHDR